EYNPGEELATGKGRPVRGPEASLGRRIAALVAILSLAGALGSVGFAVATGDLWRLPVVLIVEAVAVVGLWHGLTRRGAARVAGLLLAAASLLVVILVVVTGDYRGVPFAIAIVLILLSAAAARYALGPDSQHLQATALSRRNGLPATHPVLIMN